MFEIIALFAILYSVSIFIDYKDLAIWCYLWCYEQLLKAYKVFIVLIGGS